MTPTASLILTAIFISTLTLVGLAAAPATVEKSDFNPLAPTREASPKEKALALAGVDAVLAPLVYLIFRLWGDSGED